MTKPIKGKVDGSLIVPIVGDGLVAGPNADGRMVPVLILDTRMRPEVRELIRVQRLLPDGDVEGSWGMSRDGAQTVYLIMNFIQPMNVGLVLSLSVDQQALLIDGILASGAVILQAGVAGDRVSTTMEAPRMLVAVADTPFRSRWESVFLKSVTAEIARRHKIRRREAQRFAQDFIRETRKITKFQLPPSRDPGNSASKDS